VSTSGIALDLPAGRKTMDLARETFEQAADKMLGNDPKFDALRAQASAAAKSGAIKLFSFDVTHTLNGFTPNCNVILQDVPAAIDLDQAVRESVQELTPIVVAGTQPKVNYLNGKAGRIADLRYELRIPNTSGSPLVSHGFLALNHGKMAVVTFTIPASEESQIKPVADKSIASLYFN
jgi:hypothetical protein